MIAIFYTVVLSTDPGNGTDTQEFCLLIRQGVTIIHPPNVVRATIGY
jgi:hypothetical protein